MTNPRQFRRRPFRAHQWDGNLGALASAIPELDFMKKGGKPVLIVKPSKADRAAGHRSDAMLEKVPEIGDWIVQSPEGECWLIGAADFANRFEEIES